GGCPRQLLAIGSDQARRALGDRGARADCVLLRAQRRDVAIDPARSSSPRRERRVASSMMDLKHIRPGALIELRDEESVTWIPLTIFSVEDGYVECRTLADEPIHTTVSALVKDARLRPGDGRCRDCGHEAHEGLCVERRCAECNAEVGSHCMHHPDQPVHVYRRKRYLAEIERDKPYPTRESCF